MRLYPYFIPGQWRKLTFPHRARNASATQFTQPARSAQVFDPIKDFGCAENRKCRDTLTSQNRVGWWKRRIDFHRPAMSAVVVPTFAWRFKRDGRLRRGQ